MSQPLDPADPSPPTNPGDPTRPADGAGPPGPSWATPGRQPAPPVPTGWGAPLQPPPGWGGPGPLPPGRRPGDRRAVVPLRPLALGELLDGAVAVVRRYPRPAFAAGAVVAVVSALLQLTVLLTLIRPVLLLDDEVLEQDLQSAGDTLAGAAAGGGITFVFATFTTLLLAGLLAPAVSRGTLGQGLTAGQAWQQLRPRLAPLALTSLLVTFAIFLPLLIAAGLIVGAVALAGDAGASIAILALPAGLVLGLLLYVRWGFAPLSVVLEKQGARAALRRSAVLVKGSWWRVFGILLLTAIISGVVTQILQVPLIALGDLVLGRTPGSSLVTGNTSTSVFVVSAVATALTTTVVGPFTAGVRALLYVDRRMRAEGLDVALAAAVAAPGHQ